MYKNSNYNHINKPLVLLLDYLSEFSQSLSEMFRRGGNCPLTFSKMSRHGENSPPIFSKMFRRGENSPLTFSEMSRRGGKLLEDFLQFSEREPKICQFCRYLNKPPKTNR